MELVRQFMDVLGIERAPIIGHSMGGTAGLGAAVRNPERISSVCVIGSPIVGSSLSPFLKVAGEPWAGSLAHTFLPGLKLAIRLASPMITRDPRWYDMVARDLSATTVDSFFGSIRSLRRTDLRPRLPEIKVPVMGIYGGRDVIVDPHEYQPLAAGVVQARIEVLPNSGHFPMLDEPERYLELVRSFLSQPPAAPTVGN
jgi:pimeloyl-ACP methyl ester carboxylesterase